MGCPWVGVLKEALNDRAEECPGAARRLHQMEGTKMAVCGVPGQIEQHLDHPSTGEHLAVVLDSGTYKCHRHTIGTWSDSSYADTAQDLSLSRIVIRSTPRVAVLP